MKKWISIFFLYLIYIPSLDASVVEFSYTRDFVSFGTGSFEYDHTNPISPISNYELDDTHWNSAQYSSFVSNGDRVISILATRGNSFAKLLLRALDINLPAYPEQLSLDDFERGSIVIGNTLNPVAPVYTITSLGESTAVPLPASLWLFISGLLGLVFKLYFRLCKKHITSACSQTTQIATRFV